MYYLVKSRRTIVDKKGNDKSVTESFLVENVELFSEAEYKMLGYYNNENDVVGITRSPVREFINEREKDEQDIYMVTIESIFIDENSIERATQYLVGLFAESVKEATEKALEYMKSGLEDMTLISIKRTKIIDIIK